MYICLLYLHLCLQCCMSPQEPDDAQRVHMILQNCVIMVKASKRLCNKTTKKIQLLYFEVDLPGCRPVCNVFIPKIISAVPRQLHQGGSGGLRADFEFY